MKVSWKRCLDFAVVAQGYLERTNGAETKLKYAINRTLPRVQRQQDTVNDKLADIQIDFCLTEKRNDQDVIVRDGRGELQYTKDALKQRNAAHTAYLRGDNIEIDPYLATSLPADLSVLEIEAFSGFVISTEDADRLLSEIEAKAAGNQDGDGDGDGMMALDTAL